MRRKRQSRRIDIVIGIAIVTILIFLILKTIPISKGAPIYEEFASAEDVMRINVISDTADVFISMYEGDEIRAYLSDKKGERLFRGYKLTVKEKKDRVIIKAKKKSKLAEGYMIMVELPSKQYEQIQIQADAANINVGAIHTSGYVLKTSVGHIEVDAAQGIINADTQVGNVHINMQMIGRDVIAKTEVGNIVVETDEAPPALQTVCKTSLGEVVISLPNIQNGSIGTGGPLVKLTSDVGDVSLSLTNE